MIQKRKRKKKKKKVKSNIVRPSTIEFTNIIKIVVSNK